MVSGKKPPLDVRVGEGCVNIDRDDGHLVPSYWSGRSALPVWSYVSPGS